MNDQLKAMSNRQVSLRTKVYEWLHTGDHKAFEQLVLQEFQNDGLPSYAQMDICVYQQTPYTHAILDAGITTLGITGHGYAKCNPGDEWNSDLGAQIAVVRAARNLFRELQLQEIDR